MRSPAVVAYLTRGFQWLMGLWLSINMVLLLTKSSGGSFAVYNALIFVPVLWQIVGLRLKKASIFFDILTGITYSFLLWRGLPGVLFFGVSYGFLFYTASIWIVFWYFVRLRWFLFR